MIRRKWVLNSILYLSLSGFICGWWWLAFKDSIHTHSSHLCFSSSTLPIKVADLFPDLSLLDRERLHQSLGGDTQAMIQLIADWDIDAQRLQDKGVQGIERLSKSDYVKAHLLAKIIHQASPQDLLEFNCKTRLQNLVDDEGHSIEIKKGFSRFLPHTYIAASFLFAIAGAEQIVAIPKGLRSLPQLYPPEVLARVPQNIDRYEAEKLFLAHPHLAFVAPYSHPPVIAMLRNQNIQLCNLKNADTIEGIETTLLRMGHLSNHLLEAHLLQIFMEASFLMIDNRLRFLHQLASQKQEMTQILYLSHHHHYFIPTTRCLAGQLLQRALSLNPHLTCPIVQNALEWQVPFDQEKIINTKPDCLIISIPLLSTVHQASYQRRLEQDPVFSQLPAFQTGQIFYVDDSLQESPTQYIVLAYFDLFHALAAAHLP
jgi:iron complex transport system substrate-binding protein